MINATQLRVGMTIVHNGELCKVLEVQHITPGNWRGMVQTKLRNVRSGSSAAYRFRSEDRVEKANLEQHEMEFLYSDGHDFVFMNSENYEQMSLPENLLGDAVKYLVPNIKLMVEFHEGQPVGIEFPLTVDLKVVETEPSVKGATVSGSLKPAKLETGLVVQVPRFIEVGEAIKVDTSEGKYIERAK